MQTLGHLGVMHRESGILTGLCDCAIHLGLHKRPRSAFRGVLNVEKKCVFRAVVPASDGDHE